MVIAAIGTVLAAAYLLWLYQRTAFGEPTDEFKGHSDAEHAADGHGAHGSHGVAPYPDSAADAVVDVAHDDRRGHHRRPADRSGSPGRRSSLRSSCSGVLPAADVEVCDPAVTELVKTISPASRNDRRGHVLLRAGRIQLRGDATDWHAITPELILVIGINVVLFIDLSIAETKKWMIATLTGVIFLAAFIPVVTLGLELDGVPREMFNEQVRDRRVHAHPQGVVPPGRVRGRADGPERFEEGGYYQGEFYVLMLCSVLGMVMMASTRP